MAACRKGQRDVVKVLLTSGADVTAVSVEVRTFSFTHIYALLVNPRRACVARVTVQGIAGRLSAIICACTKIQHVCARFRHRGGIRSYTPWKSSESSVLSNGIY